MHNLPAGPRAALLTVALGLFSMAAPGQAETPGPFPTRVEPPAPEHTSPALTPEALPQALDDAGALLQRERADAEAAFHEALARQQAAGVARSARAIGGTP